MMSVVPHRFQDCSFFVCSNPCLGFPGKESACQCKRLRRLEFDPWVRKTPWRKKWQPTPVFLPEKSHGQRSPVRHSPQDCKESGTTEQLSACMRGHTHTHTHTPCLGRRGTICERCVFWKILWGCLYFKQDLEKNRVFFQNQSLWISVFVCMYFYIAKWTKLVEVMEFQLSYFKS